MTDGEGDAMTEERPASEGERTVAFLLSLRAQGVRDLAVLRAMEKVARERFAPARFADLARQDVSVPLPCGQTMTATAAPAYLGNPAHVDPEEAFVASLASCHMLTFLAIACKQKFVLDSYEDEAVGHMEKDADGKLAITRVELRPKIRWGGDRVPSAEELDRMHHAAHENCFIANSVKTKVTVTKL